MPPSLSMVLRRHITLSTSSRYEIIGRIVPSLRHDWSYEFKGRAFVENISNGKLSTPQGRAAVKARLVYKRIFDVSKFLFDDDDGFLLELAAFLRRIEQKAKHFELHGRIEEDDAPF